MSIEETNKAAKRSYIDAFKARDLGIFDRLFDPSYVIRYAGFADFRRDELRGMVSGAFESLSEVELDIDDMVAEGDKVVTRFTFKAKHVGDFLGVPATQRTITWSGIVIDRFVDGRIVEAWEIFDRFGLMQQLGAIAESE